MALDIINEQDRSSEYILGIKAPRRTWEKIKQAVGLEDIRLHDIRHSYASWSLQKINLSEVGNLLGHRDQATTEIRTHSSGQGDSQRKPCRRTHTEHY